jgi:hypothetical protein
MHMSRILDRKHFAWTPSWKTDITATLKKHGFVPSRNAGRMKPKRRAQRPATPALPE